MPVTKRSKESWIAGLMEHRVALGVAATASILMVALLVLQPSIESRSKNQAAHEAPSAASKTTQATPSTPEAHRYAIPEKSVPPQQVKKAVAPPTIKPITPSTPAKQVNMKPPAPKPVVKKPAPGKPVVKAVAKPVSNPKPVSAAPQVTNPGTKTVSKILFVQVGAYRDRRSAQQQASTMLQQGWSSMVTTNAKGLFVVRIGPVSSREAAEKLSQKLLDKAKLKGFIVEG